MNKKAKSRLAKSAERIANRKAGTAETRQKEIVKLMTAGKWIPGLSNGQLERKYGVAATTIKKDTEVAAKILRYCAGDGEDIRTLLAANVAAIRKEAMANVRTEMRWNPKTKRFNKLTVPEPDHATALRSIEVEGKLLGLMPNRVEIVTSGDEFEDWTKAQVQEYLETNKVPPEIAAQLTEKQVEVYESMGEVIETEGTTK